MAGFWRGIAVALAVLALTLTGVQAARAAGVDQQDASS